MSYDPNRATRIRRPQRSGGEAMTKQSDAAETDVNKIMNRYIRTGEFPQRMENSTYGDFTRGIDFHSAMNRVAEVEELFQRLPLAVREYCWNDPGKLLDYVYDPEKRKELEELGLTEKMAPVGAPPASEETSQQTGAEPQSENSEPVEESPQGS